MNYSMYRKSKQEAGGRAHADGAPVEVRVRGTRVAGDVRTRPSQVLQVA